METLHSIVTTIKWLLLLPLQVLVLIGLHPVPSLFFTIVIDIAVITTLVTVILSWI